MDIPEWLRRGCSGVRTLIERIDPPKRYMTLRLHGDLVKARILAQEEDVYTIEYPYTDGWFGQYLGKVVTITADDIRIIRIDAPCGPGERQLHTSPT